MTDVQVRLVVEDEDDLQNAQDLVDAHPDVVASEEIADPSGGVQTSVVPVVAVLVAAGAALVAQLVMEFIERARGGSVVDARVTPVAVSRTTALPVGFVLVVTKDGTVQIETKDLPKGAIERLLGEVISGVLGTAEAVTEAAKAIGAVAKPGDEAAAPS
jgi:hypothetical protein